MLLYTELPRTVILAGHFSWFGRSVASNGICWRQLTECGGEPGAGRRRGGFRQGQSESASNTCLEEGSTRSLFEARKSIPKMGLETAARMKLHRNVRRPKVRVFLTVPQEGMDFPSAPVSEVPEEGAVKPFLFKIIERAIRV